MGKIGPGRCPHNLPVTPSLQQLHPCVLKPLAKQGKGTTEEETKSRRKRKGICYQLSDRNTSRQFGLNHALVQEKGSRAGRHQQRGLSFTPPRDGTVPFLAMPRQFRSSPRTSAARGEHHEQLPGGAAPPRAPPGHCCSTSPQSSPTALGKLGQGKRRLPKQQASCTRGWPRGTLRFGILQAWNTVLS